MKRVLSISSFSYPKGFTHVMETLQTLLTRFST